MLHRRILVAPSHGNGGTHTLSGDGTRPGACAAARKLSENSATAAVFKVPTVWKGVRAATPAISRAQVLLASLPPSWHNELVSQESWNGNTGSSIPPPEPNPPPRSFRLIG